MILAIDWNIEHAADFWVHATASRIVLLADCSDLWSKCVEDVLADYGTVWLSDSGSWIDSEHCGVHRLKGRALNANEL